MSPPLSDKRLQRVHRAYESLRSHAESGGPFTVDQMVAASGWSISSVKTYITKQWTDFLVPVAAGGYRVRREFTRLSFDSFYDLITQKRRVFSKYKRVEYATVVSYEFLLPLTKENQLRDALDSLFYTDTVQRRLEEIGLDEVKTWILPVDGEVDKDYVERVCLLVAGKFGGYSISHVNGRFRAANIKSRAEAAIMLAADERYLIDETTAIVRFVIPLEGAKKEDTRLAGAFSFDAIGAPADVASELGQIRSLFFNLFAEAIVRVVEGEDEIWLLEDTGTARRLYVWDKA